MEFGELNDRLVNPPSPNLVKAAIIFAFTALIIGILIIVMTIYAMVFLYN